MPSLHDATFNHFSRKQIVMGRQMNGQTHDDGTYYSIHATSLLKVTNSNIIYIGWALYSIGCWHRIIKNVFKFRLVLRVRHGIVQCSGK